MIGYTDYDHAGWVEDNARAFRQMRAQLDAERAIAGKPASKAAAATKGWLTMPLPLPDWQRRAMHILGMTFGGIYNAPLSWDAVDWGGGRCLHVPIRGTMATFDDARLTAFVFLCHEGAIRGLIAPHTPGLLRISMWARVGQCPGEVADTGKRHPTLAAAVRAFTEKLGSNHPVQFGYEPPTPEAGA